MERLETAGSETCEYEWTTAYGDRRAPSVCARPAGHDGAHRSGPEGICRACGAGVALRFVPGNRDEGRQAHWIGYCGCGCDQAVMVSCPDSYRADPWPEAE